MRYEDKLMKEARVYSLESILRLKPDLLGVQMLRLIVLQLLLELLRDSELDSQILVVELQFLVALLTGVESADEALGSEENKNVKSG